MARKDKLTDRLNAYWDEIVRGRTGQADGIDESLVATLAQIHALDSAPAPTPAFAEQLWQKLQEQPAPAPAKKGSRLKGVLPWPGLILGFPGPGRVAARLAIAVLIVAILYAATLFTGQQPLQTPVVVAFAPDIALGVPVQSPITVEFNTAMNRASVEKAFKITPEVPGQFSWQGSSVTFTPLAPGLKRGTRYTVVVDSSALSAGEQSLPASFAASFVAADNLSVLTVQPFKDSVEVERDAIITVQFNNPIVPLTTLDAGKVDPLVITPPVAGQGKWLTTSVYTFRPSTGLAPSTQYAVTAKKGITDTTGSALAADYVWSFRTWTPAVTTSFPTPNSMFVGTNTPISVTFNQPIDHQSLQSKFQVAAEDGRAVAGSFVWPNDETAIFTPGRELNRGTRYTVKVDAGVLGAKGNLGMAKEFTWDFLTADLPRLVSIQPTDGSLVQSSGQIILTFNNPMDRESVIKNLEFIPKPTQVFTYWQQSDTRVSVSNVITQPSTHYRVTLKPGALDRFGQSLGKGQTVEFETEPIRPYVNLRIPGIPENVVSLSPTGNPYALLEAVNVETVKLTLSTLDKSEFLSLADKGGGGPTPVPAGKVLREWVIPAKGELNEVKVITTTLSLAEGQRGLPSGLYAIQIQSPQVQGGPRAWYSVRGLVAVGRAALTLKATSTDALVWVVDQVTGEPIGDASVTLSKFDGQTLASGKTDASGLLLAKYAEIGPDTRVFAIAEKAGDIGVTATTWSNGISSYNFNLPYRPTGPKYAVALYTDRPIYKPGDKVYIKGVARADDDGNYSLLPAEKQANVTLRDAQYRVVFSQTLPLDEFGSFNTEFPLGREASTGNYTIIAGFDGSAVAGKAETYSAGFLVAEFRKPDFEVKLSTDRKEYVQGDELAFTVKSSYFFGAPVADAKVYWEVFQKPYDFKGPRDLDGPYSFSDYQPSSRFPTFSPGGRPIATGEGKTDASGMLTIRLRADIGKETMGQVFTFEASVTDVNNQQVFGRSDAVVHKGAYYVGVRPNPRVVAAGKPTGVDVITVDTQSITVPNKAVSLELFEQKWYSVQEKGPDGRFRWTSNVESTFVARASVTTDATGKATASLTLPKAGSYKILATAKDERGNEVRSSTLVYASGSEYVFWRLDDDNRMELIADRPNYKPGDTAKVLVPSPFPKAKALLTIERGHILDYKTIDIESSSQLVEIPVESAHVPNVYVSVVLVRSEAEGAGIADFKVGYVELPVLAEEKKLSITITPDKAKYQPRETATYRIRTTDYLGKPVQAEMSLALVDASVLSLAEERVRDMFDSFYGRRSLSVSTGQTLSKSLSKVDPNAFGGGKGGGGEPDDARGLFPDVAYWNPALKTDKNGEATVSMPLPDSLTTWRLTARGTTVDTVVGTERNDILVTKQVLIRPVVPRFFIVGDEARLEAIVHNYTPDILEADVSLAAQGLAVSNQAPQRVKVAPSSTAKVYWTAKAGRDEEAKLTFRVQPVSPASAPKDAVETQLPILTYSSPEVTATSGEVRNTATEEVKLPANIDKEMGELTVKMEPSLASGMQDGLQYLESYPYECVEQTISRFLPNIVTLRALKKVGIENADLQAKLPSLVSLALQRLHNSQNPDGSWGWWPGDTGSPFITAYALYGLNEAKREGFSVQPQVMDKAAGYLASYLTRSRDVYAPENPNLRAYVLYVLAEAGRLDSGSTIALYERRDSLGRYGRAYLAMALLKISGNKADDRVKNLVEDLSSSAIASATGVHWEEASTDFRTMSTNNRTTSIVLDALVRADPTNPLIPGAVRWLMVSRGEGHWETTQETAMAVIALTDYLVTSGELDPSYAWELAVNGKKVGGDTVTKANVSTQSAFAIPIPTLLLDEANKLRMNRYPSPGEQAIKGKLYYSMYLRYFLPVQNIEAREQGIVVSREYLDANDQPVKGARLGSVLKVKVTIMASQDLHYAIIEDPLPAGVEAIDPALKTSSLSARTANADRWRFTHVDIRDEKVAFFATYLPKGTYEYTYLIRATTAGAYQALPTTAYEMYFPEVWGRSAGEVFTIRVEG